LNERTNKTVYETRCATKTKRVGAGGRNPEPMRPCCPVLRRDAAQFVACHSSK